MKQTRKFSVLLTCAAFMLSACQDKPFAKLASIMDETHELMYEFDNNHSTRDEDPNELLETFNKMLTPYLEKIRKEYNKLEGKKIDTEITDDTGLTIIEPFTATIIDNNKELALKFVAKVKPSETSNSYGIRAIGYEGDTPVIYLSEYDVNKVSEEEWEVKVNFMMMSNPKLIGRIDKIVLTADKELIRKMENDENRFDPRFPH